LGHGLISGWAASAVGNMLPKKLGIFLLSPWEGEGSHLCASAGRWDRNYCKTKCLRKKKDSLHVITQMIISYRSLFKNQLSIFCFLQ
jgi:hypothetical protein